MDDNHRFELLAAVFYMTTGIMAPGKDDPREFTRESRAAAFQDWLRKNKPINTAWLKAIEVQIENGD